LQFTLTELKQVVAFMEEQEHSRVNIARNPGDPVVLGSLPDATRFIVEGGELREATVREVFDYTQGRRR